jgi:hypothetical protein
VACVYTGQPPLLVARPLVDNRLPLTCCPTPCWGRRATRYSVKGDWAVCTYVCVYLWWASRWIRRLLVVTGARCPLTKPVVTAVELQAATEPHCSRGVQPGGICVCVSAARAGSRRPGAGLAPRPQAPPVPAAALVLYTRNLFLDAPLKS